MEAQKTIAIIHRDEPFVETLEEVTQKLGYSTSRMKVQGGTQPIQVSSFIDKVVPDLVLLAVNYQRNKAGEGIESLIEIRKNHPNLPIFMVSGGYTHYNWAMQEGATGYLPIGIGSEKYRKFLESNIK